MRNALDNLQGPVILANDLMQGEIEGAAQVTAERFAINAVGVLGIFDAAKRYGRYRHQEDFGQTLGTWRSATGRT